MTISSLPPTSPNNVEDQSPVSKPNFNIVQGGGGRGKSIFQMTLTGRHLSSVPRIMAIVVDDKICNSDDLQDIDKT